MTSSSNTKSGLIKNWLSSGLISTEISFLAKNCKKSIYTEQKDLRERFNRFKLYYHKLSPTDYQKSLIYTLIAKETRPTDIKPMTIGAFLFGSNLHNYGALSKKESILCYESVCMNEIKLDDIQYWLLIDGKYKKINQSTSEIGHIFVEDDFTHFKPHDIDLFARNNIKRGGIYKTYYSKHYAYHEDDKKYTAEETPNIKLVQFPVKYNDWKLDNKSLTKHQGSASSNWWLVFIILVVFFLLIVYRFRR